MDGGGGGVGCWVSLCFVYESVVWGSWWWVLMGNRVAYLIPVVGGGWLWWKWVVGGWKEERERVSGEVCTMGTDCKVH